MQTFSNDDSTLDEAALKKAIDILKRTEKIRNTIMVIPRGFAEAHGIEPSDNILLSDYIDCGGIQFDKRLLDINYRSTFNWEEKDGIDIDESGEGDI